MTGVLWNVLISGSMSSLVVWIARTWIGEHLKARIKAEYDQRLEEFKRRLQLESDDEIRRRRLYEELSDSLERVFGQGESLNSSELSLLMNKLFALLALYAPDDVYLAVKTAVLNKKVYGREAKPVIYFALRKSLLGDRTRLQAEDLVDHVNATQLPPPEKEAPERPRLDQATRSVP